MSPLSKLCMYHYGRILQILSEYYELFWRSDSVKILSTHRQSSYEELCQIVRSFLGKEGKIVLRFTDL